MNSADIKPWHERGDINASGWVQRPYEDKYSKVETAMLAEISELRQALEAAEAELAAIKGAGEPVAWLSPGGDVSRSKKYFEEMGFTNLQPLYTRPCVPLTDEPELLEALKRLSFAAQTTGGVAGRDEGLCAAIDAAAAVIAKVVAHTKGAKG